MPDKDATVKGLQRIALVLYVVKPDYVQAAFDAIELITGKKYDSSEDPFEEIAKELREASRES